MKTTRLFYAILVLSTTAAGARGDVSHLTPHDVARLRIVTSAAMSPDGQSIAYVLSVPRRPLKDDDGPSWAELHVVDSQGHARPFVTGDVSVSAVRWTPDGRAISFLAKRGKDESASLYTIPIDGGEARRRLTHKTDITAYDWSPDGRHVAFLATPEEPKARKERKEKGFTREIFEEESTPVRPWIAELPDASEEAPAPRLLDVPGSAADVEWSPVGERLLVTLAPTPRVDDQYMNQKLSIVDIESAKIVATFDTPGKLGQFRWSPDGSYVAMIAAGDRHDPAEGRLMIGTATGGPVRDVLPEYAGHVTSIAWQDGDTVMFTGAEGVETVFGKINIDGSERKVIVPGGQAVLSGLSLARDGMSGAFLGHTPQHPAEVFAMRHGDAGPRRLTDSNPWLGGKRLARQELVEFKARDGLMIQGLLIRPLEEQAGVKYPLVVVVHGGPEAHYANGWITRYSDPGQVAAARGFAVFYPNYRGSTGRGVEFSKLGQADYAGKEFDDLVDGVDHLIAAGIVDPKKVGITGGSYGGYATAWCATYYSERFAAAVMHVGISDHVSKAGTTDIPEEMYLVHARKRPWEDWQWFRDRSPIYHAQKARTPILIMHGKDDTRVNPGQSLELYRYLKTLGQTPVRLVWYPGEGHGNRKAAARLDYSLRLMQWMEHYLQGPGGEPPPYEIDYKDEHEPAASTQPAGQD